MLNVNHFPANSFFLYMGISFEGSGFSYPIVVRFYAYGSYAWQVLWAVALMLCKMAFWLSDKMVTLHLENSTAKAYLCNQGDTTSIFFPDYPSKF